MATLILLKSPGGSSSGERIEIQSGQYLLGRDPDQCQIHVDDGRNAVSRKHARIDGDRNGFFLVDLHSRNKTYLNNKEIDPEREPVKLHDDDRIKICDFLFRFSDPKSPRPVQSRPPLGETQENELEPSGVVTNSTIEATVARVSTGQLLELQPADKLKALIEISSSLGSTLEMDKLLTRISETLFGLFKQADRCFVIEWEEATDQLRPRAVHTRRPGQVSEQFSRTIVRKCLETLHSFLSEDASEESGMGTAQSIADFKIRSVMCVPMITPDGKPWGVIQLDSQDRTKKFTKDDVRLLSAVANQAAIALDNTRLHADLVEKEKEKNEIELARKVQEGLLPQHLPEIPEYAFFAHYLAAHSVGGDYYDFIKLADGRVIILLGDVSGKGVPAAILVAKLSAEAKFCFRSDCDDLAEGVRCLNENLCEANLGDRYVTFVAAMLDPAEHTLTLVNAGHEIPLIYRGATGAFEPVMQRGEGGFPLTWVPGYEYESFTVPFEAGDSLLLFTDGVSDSTALDGKKFGHEGIDKALLSDSAIDIDPIGPIEIGERLRDAVIRHGAGRPQFDDIAMVCFGRIEEQNYNTLKTNATALVQ